MQENTKEPSMKKLKLTARPSRMVSIRIPLDTVEQLKRVASAKDLGYQSLLKLYIGEGLRDDLENLKKERLLSQTENVLRKHLKDDKRLNAILGNLKRIAAL